MRFAAAAMIAACSLIGCEPEPQVLRGTTMGTTYTIKYVGGDGVDELRRDVEAVLAEVNGLFSTYDPQSEISRFNAWQGTGAYPVSARFAGLVGLALEVARRTDGGFDPTMLPLVDLYGFGLSRERRVPSDGEIAKALRRIGYHHLEIAEDGRLTVLHPELQLDLSAIAKGQGVDRVCEALVTRGIASYMVEIGGEVRCAGLKPGEEPWTIGIEGPGESRNVHVVEKVKLRDAALATSGSYRNFVRTSEATVHHILDPRTGKNPESGVVSVSVLALTCALADALATAFMVLGPERAKAVLDGYGDAAALFLMGDEGNGVRVQRVGWR